MTETASEIESYFDRLWPIMRSITGPGVRLTHDILSELHPLERIEVPTGTRAFDWRIPQEWRVNAAYLVDPDGRRILDVARNTLHLVNYSVPFRGVLERSELDEHLHSLPEQPDAIPYVTSYYQPRWGFCLPHAMRSALPDGRYQVVVDTELFDGSLTIGEAVLPGRSTDEVLISTYTCHPSLANNELSGPLTAAFLMRRLARWPERRLTYRFVFAPETIGSITYLSLRGEHLKRTVKAGFVVTCCGDGGPFTYKLSKQENGLSDRAARHVLVARHRANHRIVPFRPDQASDERIYSSPAFNLPIGSIMRAMYGTYPEYHTSLDDKSVVSFDALGETIGVYEAVLQSLDRNVSYRSLVPEGEPELGRRGIYPTLSRRDSYGGGAALFWLLHYADGAHDLLDIAERSGVEIGDLHLAAERLVGAGLLAST